MERARPSDQAGTVRPVGIGRGGQVCDGRFVLADEDPDERIIPADLVAAILHARKASYGRPRMKKADE